MAGRGVGLGEESRLPSSSCRVYDYIIPPVTGSAEAPRGGGTGGTGGRGGHHSFTPVLGAFVR